MDIEQFQAQIDRLQRHRRRPEPDRSLRFLSKHFKHEIERPYKQLGELSELWARLVPQPLIGHTRLEGFSRGVLRVAVDSSSHLYELDRLLRSGLQIQLIRAHRLGSIRRIKLRVAGGHGT